MLLILAIVAAVGWNWFVHSRLAGLDLEAYDPIDMSYVDSRLYTYWLAYNFRGEPARIQRVNPLSVMWSLERARSGNYTSRYNLQNGVTRALAFQLRQNSLNSAQWHLLNLALGCHIGRTWSIEELVCADITWSSEQWGGPEAASFKLFGRSLDEISALDVSYLVIALNRPPSRSREREVERETELAALAELYSPQPANGRIRGSVRGQ